MPLTEEQRRTLAARASSLRERLGHGEAARSGPRDAWAVAARLARWRQVSAKGDLPSFERLLDSRHIAPHRLDPLLGASAWHEGTAVPGWVDTVDAAIAAASLLSGSAQPLAGLLLASFCAVGRKRLAASLPAGAFRLSDQAVQALVDSLEHGLQFVCRSALEAPVQQALPVTEFLLEYSVAARAMATLVDRWHGNTLDLVLRLTADAKAIEHQFLAGAPLGDVTRIDCGLSDPHNGGKSVLRLYFASGLRLVYKPRSVTLDLAYNTLLDWLTQQGAPHPLRKPVYLARPGYAWIEQIDHVPCQSQGELLQFCRTTGALLCTSYLLDATDLHDGNVVAVGTSPVIVDLETLLQPRLAEPPSNAPQDALRAAAVLADRSTLRTGLLPSLKLGADGQVADVGCLGSLFAPLSAAWYSHEPTASPLSQALRKDIATGVLDPMALAGAIADGFRQTYLFLLAKREALLAPDGPLRGFSGQPVRFLLRDTSVYIKMLAPSLSAMALREGVDRSIALESLYRLLHNRPGSEALLALVDEEIAALESLDIPLLSTTTDSTSLDLANGGPGPTVFAEPSYAAMLARLRTFSPQDLDLQLELLQGSFAARAAGSSPPATRHADTRNPFTTPEAIAAELHRRAITGEDGSVTWMAPVPIPNTPYFRFDMLPLNKESGLAGVALFLAAYSWATGDAAAGTLARRAVQTVTQRLGLDVPPTGHTALPLAGLGPMVDALRCIGALLDDSGIGAAALRLAPLALDGQPLGAEPMGASQAIVGMPVGTFFPSFDQGLCGIGYAMLRDAPGTPLPSMHGRD